MDIVSTASFFLKSPVDWIIVAVIFALIAVDAWRHGTGRAATLALTLPLTVFTTGMLSHTSLVAPLIAKSGDELIYLALFTIIFGVLFFFVYRIMFGPGGVGVPVWVAVAAALSATVIALTVWQMEPFLRALWPFSPFFQSIFSQAHAFWWLILGLFLMAFMRS